MFVFPQDIGGLWCWLDMYLFVQDLSVVVITSEEKIALVANHVETLVSSEFSLKNDKCRLDAIELLIPFTTLNL
jgi:hypothetical protein